MTNLDRKQNSLMQLTHQTLKRHPKVHKVYCKSFSNRNKSTNRLAQGKREYRNRTTD